MMLQPPAYYTYFDASHCYPNSNCSMTGAPSLQQAPITTTNTAYTNLPTPSFYYYPTPALFPTNQGVNNGLSFTTSSGPSSSSNCSMNKVGNCSLYYMDPNWLNPIATTNATATAAAAAATVAASTQQSCGFQNNIFVPPSTAAGAAAPLLSAALAFQQQQEQQQPMANNNGNYLTNSNVAGWNLMNIYNYDYINTNQSSTFPLNSSCLTNTSTATTTTTAAAAATAAVPMQNVDQVDSMFNLFDTTGQFIKGLLSNHTTSPAMFATTTTSAGSVGVAGGAGGAGGAGAGGVGKKRKRVVYSNNILYKTILCHDFISNQTCPRGKLCQFAHGEEDLHKPNHHDLYHSKLCDAMLRSGFCPRGDRCFYAHNVNELKSQGINGTAGSNNCTPTPLLLS